MRLLYRRDVQQVPLNSKYISFLTCFIPLTISLLKIEQRVPHFFKEQRNHLRLRKCIIERIHNISLKKRKRKEYTIFFIITYTVIVLSDVFFFQFKPTSAITIQKRNYDHRFIAKRNVKSTDLFLFHVITSSQFFIDLF